MSRLFYFEVRELSNKGILGLCMIPAPFSFGQLIPPFLFPPSLSLLSLYLSLYYIVLLLFFVFCLPTCQRQCHNKVSNRLRIFSQWEWSIWISLNSQPMRVVHLYVLGLLANENGLSEYPWILNQWEWPSACSLTLSQWEWLSFNLEISAFYSLIWGLKEFSTEIVLRYLWP